MASNHVPKTYTVKLVINTTPEQRENYNLLRDKGYNISALVRTYLDNLCSQSKTLDKLDNDE